MELNRTEIEVRHAYVTALSHTFLTADKVEEIWARAATDNEFEAKEWLWETNAVRHMQRSQNPFGV